MLLPAKALLADKGYDADWFRDALADRNYEACIPSKSNRKIQIPHDKVLYRKRHKIESMFVNLRIGGASTPATTDAPTLRALQGLQSVDLVFDFIIAPLHFERIPDRINVSVQGSGEPHDGRYVRFDRIVDPGGQWVCFSTTQDAIETHVRRGIVVKAGEPSLRASTFLACSKVNFPLGLMKSATAI